MLKKQYLHQLLYFLSLSNHSWHVLSPLSTPADPPPYLQHQLRHLEPLLQALVGRHRFMVEEAQQVVSLQSLLVVALVDVQHPVLPVKIGELQTFFSTAKENQVKAQAGQQRKPRLLHF